MPWPNKEKDRQWRVANKEKLKENNDRWRYSDPRKPMFHQARTRARTNNLPFKISMNDIKIPKRCPIFGMELKVNRGGPGAAPNSPSLDRVINSKGYIPGNVRVISYRANQLKRDMDKKTAKKFYDYICGKI